MTGSLTTGQDVAVGNNLDNSFKANVVQNDSGAQVNTLGSGDELYGQGGVDTLNAKIRALTKGPVHPSKTSDNLALPAAKKTTCHIRPQCGGLGDHLLSK